MTGQDCYKFVDWWGLTVLK